MEGQPQPGQPQPGQLERPYWRPVDGIVDQLSAVFPSVARNNLENVVCAYRNLVMQQEAGAEPHTFLRARFWSAVQEFVPSVSVQLHSCVPCAHLTLYS